MYPLELPCGWVTTYAITGDATIPGLVIGVGSCVTGIPIGLRSHWITGPEYRFPNLGSTPKVTDGLIANDRQSPFVIFYLRFCHGYLPER